MRESKPWTPSEMRAAITCIEKFSTISKAADYLAPKLGRTTISVRNRMYSIKKNEIIVNSNNEVVWIVKKPSCYVKLKDRVAPTDNIEKRVDVDVVKKESIAFPEGFSFDFKPSKAEMFNDHIKLYF
jgi:hypothetical protein